MHLHARCSASPHVILYISNLLWSNVFTICNATSADAEMRAEAFFDTPLFYICSVPAQLFMYLPKR